MTSGASDVSVAGMPPNVWSILWTLAGIVGLTIAIMYVLAPIVIKKSQYQRAKPQFVPLLAEEIPDFASQFIAGLVNDLGMLGFVAVESLRVKDQVPDVSASLTILENRERGESCQLICSWGSFSLIRSAHINIISQFADGHRIVTSSVKTGVFPPDRTCGAIILPEMNRPALLVEVHRRQRARAGGERAILPEPGQWLEHVTRETISDLQRVADAGYYTLDAHGFQYEPTWKGAYLMTWKMLPPVKQIKLLTRRVKGWLALRSLGVNLHDYPE
jgi:hypothetical protein